MPRSEADPLPALPSRGMLCLLAGAFLLVALLVYGRSLGNGFVRWDDGLLITENPIIRGIGLRNIAAMFSTYDPELYIPATFFSYALDYMIGGTQPFVYHLHSLLLHVGVALAVAWLLYLLFDDPAVALLCGLLFLLHPLHVEALAWASGRKDLISTFYGLLAMIAYLQWREDGRRGLYWLSLALFTVALLGKVMIATLPVLLLLLDDLRGRRVRRGDWSMLADKLPYAALSVLLGLVAIFGKTQVIAKSTPWDKVLMAAKSTVFYLQTFVAPFRLSVLYPYTGEVTVSSPDFFVPLLLVALLVAAALWSRRFGRAFFFGIAFFLVAVAPTFVNFAKGGIDLYFASDRYAYLPSVGLVFLVALGLEAAGRRKAMLSGLLACVTLVFAGFAYRQSLYWKDTETLFGHALELYPNSHVAWANMGNAHRRAGEDAEAIAAFEKALAIEPNSRTYSNLGAVYRKHGDLPRARAQYEKALALNPESSVAHFGMGILLLTQRDAAGAMREYEEAIRLDPRYEEAYVNKGALLLKQGKPADAEDAYREAIRINPAFADAHYNLGVLLAAEKRDPEAIDAYRAAIREEPLSLAARLNLGVLLYNRGERDEAVELFRQVLRIDPDNGAAAKALGQIAPTSFVPAGAAG